MEPQQQEPTLEESIKQVMQTLPSAIRNYLAQGEYSFFAKELKVKYDLSDVQSVILEREIMLVLMGVENPEEFAVALKDEAKISEDILNKIINMFQWW